MSSGILIMSPMGYVPLLVCPAKLNDDTRRPWVKATGISIEVDLVNVLGCFGKFFPDLCRAGPTAFYLCHVLQNDIRNIHGRLVLIIIARRHCNLPSKSRSETRVVVDRVL